MSLENQLAARKEVILRRRAKKGEQFNGSANIREEYHKERKEAGKKSSRTKHENNPVTIFRAEHGGLTPEEYQILLDKGLTLEDLSKNKDGTVCKRFLSGPKKGQGKHRLRTVRRKMLRGEMPKKSEAKNHQERNWKNPLGGGSTGKEIDIAEQGVKSHKIIDTCAAVMNGNLDWESLPGFYNTKHTPDTKVHAVVAYIVTGSFAEASRFTTVPATTIMDWRKNSGWWPTVAKYVQLARQEELDTQLSGVIHKSMELVQDRLEDGDYKYNPKLDKLVRVPMSARDAAAIADRTIHNRNLLRGDPTSRTETSTLAEQIAELKEQFKSFGAEAKLVEGEVDERDD